MINFFYEFNPLYLTIIMSLFGLFMTTLGSAIVFLFKTVSVKNLNYLLSLSAGIMLSASIFSLLIPALEHINYNLLKIFLLGIIIVLSFIFLIISDNICEKFLNKKSNSLILIVSIILHNIPEGCAIGVAFGMLKYVGMNEVFGAISLALGIAIQNLPEGSAISIPLKRNGLSNFKSFLIGTLSGIVEPIAALVGYFVVIKTQIIMPYLLAFASGAMLYVVVSELIPESMNNDKKKVNSLFFISGFIMMVILEFI